MPATASRLSVFTESVIRGTTRMATQYGAVNLSQGFPDFDPPQELLTALGAAARGSNHQYAVTYGAANFREALAAKISRFTGLNVNAETELVVTCGSTEAMMVAMMTACNPGDKVIVFSPFYENYAADAILSGAIPIYVPLHAPTFDFDEDELARAFAQKPKAIVICNPGNPTGKVFTRAELLTILRLAEEHDAFVITDEPYEHIVYAPHEHVYFSTLPGAFERTITCNSLSALQCTENSGAVPLLTQWMARSTTAFTQGPCVARSNTPRPSSIRSTPFATGIVSMAIAASPSTSA